MCGIWGYIASSSKKEIVELFESFMKVQNRGPDRSNFNLINKIVKMYLGFHRLSIMDESTAGDQPFTLEHMGRSIYVMCNGEIYNHKQLIRDNDIICKSGSDCEIIPHMYVKYGFQGTLEQLVGEFAISILDVDHKNNIVNLYIGRDQTGVRPVFIGIDDDGIGFSSTLAGLIKIIDPEKIRQLNRAEIINVLIESDGSMKYQTNIYHKFEAKEKNNESEFDEVELENALKNIKSKLIDAVTCRLESDRPIGALLSGGLDSSLVVAIAANHLRKKGKKLRTFSIGIPGSTDKKYAEMVAAYCDTDHTHVEFTNNEFLKTLPKVIKVTESYDITTNRASTGHYLIARWIRENTDIKVVLGGDGSDEVCSGYMYFHNAPSVIESHKENIRLVEDIGFFDVLRADRCIAYNGLEARVPFLHHPFVEYYLSLPPRLRIPIKETENGRRIEKWLLRKAFDNFMNDEGKPWLPKEILWRMKEAFSDGVSGIDNSWFIIIQKDIENKFTQDDFDNADVKFHIEPKTKEGLYIRLIFNKEFHPRVAVVIPYYWMARWSGNINDPSARVLRVYNDQI